MVADMQQQVQFTAVCLIQPPLIPHTCDRTELQTFSPVYLPHGYPKSD